MLHGKKSRKKEKLKVNYMKVYNLKIASSLPPPLALSLPLSLSTKLIVR